MNTNAICPISDKTINENVARLNGIFTVALLAIFLVTENLIPVLFLLFDFTLRTSRLRKYSPFAVISTRILSALKIKNKPVNAGPKIFAAGIGVFFNIAIITFSLVNYPAVASVFALVFAFCAFLEGVFGFCVACKIYPYVYNLSAFFRKFQIN